MGRRGRIGGNRRGRNESNGSRGRIDGSRRGR